MIVVIVRRGDRKLRGLLYFSCLDDDVDYFIHSLNEEAYSSESTDAHLLWCPPIEP